MISKTGFPAPHGIFNDGVFKGAVLNMGHPKFHLQSGGVAINDAATLG